MKLTIARELKITKTKEIIFDYEEQIVNCKDLANCVTVCTSRIHFSTNCARTCTYTCTYTCVTHYSHMYTHNIKTQRNTEAQNEAQ